MSRILEIKDQIIAQLKARIGGSFESLPRSFIDSYTLAISAIFEKIDRSIQFAVLQAYPTTASFNSSVFNGKELTPLIELGRMIGAGDPLEGDRAEFEISIPTTSESFLAQGSQLVDDQGRLYITTQDFPLAPPSQSIFIQAIDPGQKAVTEFSFLNPIPVGSPVFVRRIIDGSDGESESEYRRRVIAAWRRDKTPGSLVSLRDAALSVNGIKKAYIYPSESCCGVIEVYVDGEGGKIQEVTDALTKIQPVGTFLQVKSINFALIKYTVSGVSNIQARPAIDSALRRYTEGAEPYIRGLTDLPERDVITTADVLARAGAAAGSYNTSLTGARFTVNGFEIPFYQLKKGELLKFEGVSFVV